MDLLSLINPSLEIIYCSTILSNYCIIRFIRFLSDFTRGYGMGLVSYPYLILLIIGQLFEVTIVHGKFWEHGRCAGVFGYEFF